MATGSAQDQADTALLHGNVAVSGGEGGGGGTRIAVEAGGGGRETKADEFVRNPSDGGVGRTAASAAGPPIDDCCPICFGDFSVACKANCCHWYCGGCILQFWNYSAAAKPCKCPMCSSSITKLTPEALLLNQPEQGVKEVLQDVERYNRLYVGGARGLIQKVRESPLFFKRIVMQMMDPDRPEYFLQEARLLAKKEPCDYFEWHDIRAALYKERKRLGEMVSNLQLENADLRAALDRVSKHSVDVGIESKNVISSYEEIVVAIKSIKLRLDQLEAGSSKLK